MQVRDAGVWKTPTPHARDGGVWKPVQEVWARDAGAWKKVWQNALFTITATGISISTASGPTVTYRGWSRAGGMNYYDLIPGDVVTPLELEAGATVITAYILTNSSIDYSFLSIDIADTRGSSTIPAVDTLGWKSTKACTINGVVTVQGTWVNTNDIKTGAAYGTRFASVGAPGLPGNSITQEQLAAILAASPAPNTLTFAFS